MGVKVLHKLVSESDILVENYLPDTLQKYGLDYTTLQKINPRLIYASISGYGQTGPYRSRAGYDVMVEGEFGLMHITGPKNGPLVKVGVAVTDLTTGLYTSNSIMAAIIARARTGMGQHIDVALSDCQVATLTNIASSHLISGENDDGRWGTAHPSIVPYRSFLTKDGEILLGGGNNHLFGLICDGINRPELKSDIRFVDNSSRVTNRYELESIIELVTQTETTGYWMDLFAGSGLPCSEIRDIKSTLSNEHVLARGMIQEIEHKSCGRIKLLNTPVKFSQSQPRIQTAPPMLGEHTVSVLKDILGFKDDDILELRRVGAIK
ncbi:Succinate--hydroxymethylglutarate CoA-transferase [Erysiphe neolycopersici]|uniref:Succinate--hydroxymethylglutarate CoA-transferase n=1 Tax=Erysiphe neolycopersici TaxID=212602 RepID=A0A420HWS0_9PEZI|nr:Succinate--hydroxymethylglutarate CoA-transferase [Erysiphe neolycopersici]